MSKSPSKSLLKKSAIESQDDSERTKLLKSMLALYVKNLSSYPENIEPELEVRFGTKNIQRITKIEFNNVLKSLMSHGFIVNNENYFLKIILENEHSNIRTELCGLPNIQHYCKYNNITNIEDLMNIKFVEKTHHKDEDTGEKLYPLDFDDYNFRVSYQNEKSYNYNDSIIKNVMDRWNSTKKIFRFIKRIVLTHPLLPFVAHLSVVKTSSIANGRLVPQFNIKDSNVFNSLEHYEIEIEVNNAQIGIKTDFSTGLYLHDIMKKIIKYILSGLQESNYPISILEQKYALNNYMKLIKGQDYNSDKKLTPKDFIGPSSSTLQLINILYEKDINDTNNSIPNIRKNYTVTDKADGIRKLLYIDGKGKIYLIPMNMNIQFTGILTKNSEIFNTILDGEHILYNKKGEFINLFAIFDCYIVNNKNVTSLPFINVADEVEKKAKIDDEEKETNKVKENKEAEYRLIILNSVHKKMKPESIIEGAKPNLNIVVKKFYASNIFQGSAKILDNINKNQYEYNTDGLIFTPANTGVASKKTGVNAPNYKVTWEESFKWKPPEYNTIDFLVKFKKNEMGEYIVGNIHNNGINMDTTNQIQQYYTLILNVGYDEKKHGYINPFNDLINDYVKNNIQDSKNDYKPARFYPTNPSDSNAGICNIIGDNDKSNLLKIYTLEGEEIEDNTIVEFSYDSSKPEFYKWVPLRMRYDKTSELRAGIKNFGNAYHVANSNWQSIHAPVTEKIITTGENVRIDNSDDDVYYNKVSNKTETRPLRDFHNLYVKNTLINKLTKPGNILMDFACGKGGDLPKWISANLDFVFGIDINKDNIENRIDGACARYLNYSQKFNVIPKALFINGNSSANIKNGNAYFNDKNRMISKAIFGEGTKNEVTLGRGVYKNYGIASNGFNITSIQFALHYMFENESILNEFLTNVAQTTALNGYFIGTCFDGRKIFNMLSQIDTEKSKSLFKNDKKIWEITKKYGQTELLDDESCMGYAIDVYQESINKTFREYLVNFNYLNRLLENYGFVMLTSAECKQMGLNSSVGGFNELYNNMTIDIKKDKNLQNKIGNANNMSNEEKEISFLNNYFIYKKVRNIDINVVNNQEPLEDEKNVEDEMKKLDDDVENIQKESIELKAKSIAENDLQKLETTQEKPEKVKTEKMKLKMEEKLKLAEEKKKLKEEQKRKEKEAKLALKESKAKEKTEAKEKAKIEKSGKTGKK
jgi:hypothetical protein